MVLLRDCFYHNESPPTVTCVLYFRGSSTSISCMSMSSCCSIALPSLTDRIQLRNDLGSPAAIGRFSDVLMGTLDGKQDVAVKVIRADHIARYMRSCLSIEGGHGSLPEDIERELSIWKSLEHQNILPLLGHCHLYGRYVALVSPWLRGGTVDKSRMKTRGEELRMITGLAQGLAYMHNRGIVHGDVKGSNILVDSSSRKPRPVLCDFGLSHFAEESEDRFSGSGTIPYMAPELFIEVHNIQQDPMAYNTTFASDVWSWAMTAYEILSGYPPFSELNISARALRSHVIAGLYPQFSKHPNKSYAKSLQDLLTSCWNLDPSLRPSMEDIVDKLRSIGPQFKLASLPSYLHAQVSDLWTWGLTTLRDRLNRNRQPMKSLCHVLLRWT